MQTDSKGYDTEVNLNYKRSFRGAAVATAAPLADVPMSKVATSRLSNPKRLCRRLWLSLQRTWLKHQDTLRILSLPFLILMALGMIAWLKLRLLGRKQLVSPLYQETAARVNDFVEQYPFHFYAVLAKSFEWAHLNMEFNRRLPRNPRVIEAAIGEGTLSARMFSGRFSMDAGIIALDLNPLSLRKAAELPHVRQAIICDCLAPPIKDGCFDLVLSNNFVSHVTNKGQMLENWSRFAEYAIFNDETPYWQTAWAGPFILRHLGLKRLAQINIDAIMNMHCQSLRPKHELDQIVNQDWIIDNSVSYISERTFFYCALFSLLMRATGPPVPDLLKKAFLGPLRWPVLPLTQTTAHLLIAFDEYQDRKKDAFVSYTLRSKDYKRQDPPTYLLCPKCRADLDAMFRCAECNQQFQLKDKMLFLLTDELKGINREYDSVEAAAMPREHL